MRQLVRLFRFWWTFESPVDGRSYGLHGLSLAAVKYAGDVTIVALGSGRLWTPRAYFHSVNSLLSTTFAGVPSWLMPVLALWTLPFLWAGVTLTVRRAMDAGWSPWWSFGFFVPYVNYVLMAVLCFVPTKVPKTEHVKASQPNGRWLSNTVLSVTAGTAVGLLMVVFGVMFLRQYSLGLFLGAPFAMGALTAFLFNRRYAATSRQTIQVTIIMFIFVAGAAFLLATEGVICILMALPLALGIGLLGAAMGRMIASCGRRAVPPALAGLLLLPLSAALEPRHSTGRVLHEVRSAIEIDAPPQRVWPHVISFRQIPEPKELLFRTGIAYPSYAHIEGAGVGAVRFCAFSTGAFVEPITTWEPGRRLAFNVASSPATMRELSLYANVSPPHLNGYLRSQRGEFRLITLPGNRTRLEGSTWYEMEMAPEAYWQLFSDYLIHRIHLRVLYHIRQEVEGER